MKEKVVLPAGPEHAAEIARLAGLVWRAHYPGIITMEQIDYMLGKMYDLDVLRREMTEGITYVRLLQGNLMCGFASYGPCTGEMKLYKLYVRPEHQRCGFGTALIEHVESVTRERGFPVLMLTVNKRNHQAIAAYRKHGFTIREAIVADIGHGFVMDDYVMAKALGAALPGGSSAGE